MGRDAEVDLAGAPVDNDADTDDLSAVPESARHERDGEEQGMPRELVPLDEVRGAVLAGRLQNMTLAVGVLAACAARDAGWETLAPA